MFNPLGFASLSSLESVSAGTLCECDCHCSGGPVSIKVIVIVKY